MPARGTAKRPALQSKARVTTKKASAAAIPTKVSRPSSLTGMMHVRVPSKLKKQATLTLERIGMTLPDAMRLFMNRIVIEQALPLRLDVPNAVTRAALDESMEPKTSRFATPQEMFDSLNEKAGDR